MVVAELEEGYSDPFDAETAPGLSLIVLMRIYDVQMALLAKTDPDAAEALYEAHAKGHIIGPLPAIDMGGPNE